MSRDADVIVVGSGPSGVAVAFPMVEAGMRVLLLDVGRGPSTEPPPPEAYHDIRRNDPDQWRLFLGSNLEALRKGGPPSPKFDAPGSHYAFKGFEFAQRMVGENFTVVGSLARGGLSNIWGAGLATFDDEDLAEFPFDAQDLAASYLRICQRMGVGGFAADDVATPLDAEIPSQRPMKVCENARRLLVRYEKKRSKVQAAGVRMGRPRIAVLTEAKPGRGECVHCDMCLWGCRVGAIYSAAHDVEALKQRPNLEYRPGLLVEKVAAVEGGYRLLARPTAAGGTETGRQSFQAPVLVLATGTLATTRLVLEMQGRFDETIPMVGSPAVGFALCLPEQIGAEISTREFSMGQISFIADDNQRGQGHKCYGNLFPATGIPGSLIIDRMPVTRPAAIRLFKYLQPSLLLGNCFLPGEFSQNTATLRSGNEGSQLIMKGGVSDDLAARLDDLKRQLGKSFRSLGAFLIPPSFTATQPGQDLRYSCTFPMRASPGRGEVDEFGELAGSARLHIVDMSVFPRTPSKHHTLTMMANADRIGETIARRWENKT